MKVKRGFFPEQGDETNLTESRAEPEPDLNNSRLSKPPLPSAQVRRLSEQPTSHKQKNKTAVGNCSVWSKGCNMTISFDKVGGGKTLLALDVKTLYGFSGQFLEDSRAVCVCWNRWVLRDRAVGVHHRRSETAFLRSPSAPAHTAHVGLRALRLSGGWVVLQDLERKTEQTRMCFCQCLHA